MIQIISGDIIARYMQEEKKETLWEIREPICVQLSNGDVLVIPCGFVTDFASVPKFLWSLIAPIGHYNLASIIHDYFYTYKTKDRKFADKEFLRWMNFTSVNTRTRNRLMYWGVRIGGSRRYKQKYL